jgi:ABC-type nitrate/sulfonate/bicarbonate transport system permease component
MSKSIKRGSLSLVGPVLILVIWIYMSGVIDNKLILPAPAMVFQHFLTPFDNIIGLGALTKNILVSLLRVFFWLYHCCHVGSTNWCLDGL